MVAFRSPRAPAPQAGPTQKRTSWGATIAPTQGAGGGPGAPCSAWGQFPHLPPSSPASEETGPTLAAGAQELLDRPEDGVAVGDAAAHDVVALAQHLVDVLVELARAVGALHLPVAEQVQLRQQLVLQDLHAGGDVVAPVVAVGEVEGVHVPLVRGVAGADDLVGQAVGRADLRTPRLARVVERVLVHLLRRRVVDDVGGLDALVVRLDPGVDPERLDAHDLLLLVGHRAGDVHHVDDGGDRLRQPDFLPGAVLLVLPDRHDHGVHGVVGVGGDLPLERPLEGALEVAQRLGADLADRAVLVAGGEDVLLALGLDPRQGQLLAEDLGQLLHGQLDLEDVAAGLVAGLGLAVALGGGQRLADLALALAGAAGVLLAVAELRDVDRRQGDRHQVAPLLADHLAAADVLRQVRLDLAADDFAEPLQVALDLLSHGPTLGGVGSRKSPRGRPVGWQRFEGPGAGRGWSTPRLQHAYGCTFRPDQVHDLRPGGSPP